MARLLCMHASTSKVSSEISSRSSTSALIKQNGGVSINGTSPRTLIVHDVEQLSPAKTVDNTNVNLQLEEVRNLTNAIKNFKGETMPESNDVNESNWRKIANIWDMFFFWLFFVMQVLITPVMFGIAPAFKTIPNLLELEVV